MDVDVWVEETPIERVGSRDGSVEVVVAIPINNEEERIQSCLSALVAQTGCDLARLGVLLFLNNCTDGTAEAIAAVTTGDLRVRVLNVQSAEASAGWARRCALEAAAEWLESNLCDDGVLLTSDADSRVAPDWVSRNLAHIANGADAVAGRIVLDPEEAAQLPQHLHARGRLEAAYEMLLTEIGARLDPNLADPWPCHWTRSGATLAFRLSSYRAIGGMPALPHGEDSAFVVALCGAGFRVRHAPDIEVITSGRLVGRASGGAADTMKMRCEEPDSRCDDRLERLDYAVRRVFWRRYLRRLYTAGNLARVWTWAPLLGIPLAEAARITSLTPFGKVHHAIEAASPRLAYRPLTPPRLPAQIRRAKVLVSVLRRFRSPDSEAHRDGIRPFDVDIASPQTQPTIS